MRLSGCRTTLYRLLGAGGFALLAAASRADVLLDAAVTFDGSLYHYRYDVVNNTDTSLAIATFQVIPGSDTILNPIAPAGFILNVDSGLGLVDFIADTGDFAPNSTVPGFTFDSAKAPMQSSFLALNVNGEAFSGMTQSPNVPEPGSLALVGAGLSAGVLFVHRRRARKTDR